MKHEIIKLPVGAKVTKAGLYRTPLAHYHTQLTPTPCISSSGLRDIMKAPQYFWRFSNLNPDAYPRKVSPAMTFGRAAHAVLLGDEVFEDKFVVSHYDSFRSKEAKDWRADMIKFGKEVLTAADMVHINEMSKNLNNEPIIQAGLLEGDTEVSMIWQDRETGVWLKARPDLLPSSGFTSDLKTTTTADPKACFYKTRDMRYDMQMALATMGLRELLDLETEACSLLYVENKEPYMTFVQDIPLSDLAEAEIDVRSAINDFAEALDSGHWSGYVEGSYKHPNNQGT
ncbi:MAG: PD-(D/E)XK nuclease-like domain-containing protein [Rhodobacteraceae bacterium]|nr:PD-(D/E)XK nuclease-like domain-containing protein [Paracoccaceae bacterium]